MNSSGPSSTPLQTLLIECSQEIEAEIRSLIENLDARKDVGKDRLNRVLRWIESISRMHARLAADRDRAMQIERDTLRFVKELRRNFPIAPRTNEFARCEELQGRLNILLTRVRQLPSIPLSRTWPDTLKAPTLLHSIYRHGNMSLVLQFLLTASQAGRIDVVTAYLDYAHIKLLEILHKTCSSMRVVCNSDCSEVFETSSHTLSEVTCVRPNLHCRLAIADCLAMISSADLNADYASHLEAGMIIERKHADPGQFVNSVWAGSIPLRDFRVGLSKQPYRTSHILIGLKSLLDLRGVPPVIFPLQEVSADVYELLASYNISGYLDYDREKAMVFVNVRTETQNPELSDAITATCTRQFHDWFSVISIQQVIDAEERDKHITEQIRNVQPITLLFFSSGTKEDVAARARRIEGLARDANTSVRCIAFFLDSRKIVYGNSTAASRVDERYLCLVHLGGLVAVSSVLDEREIEIRSIRRYMNECKVK